MSQYPSAIALQPGDSTPEEEPSQYTCYTDKLYPLSCVARGPLLFTGMAKGCS